MPAVGALVLDSNPRKVCDVWSQGNSSPRSDSYGRRRPHFRTACVRVELTTGFLVRGLSLAVRSEDSAKFVTIVA
jgi:hypothetical protein